MKKVLITGISGQDGSYLAELLLEKGYEVYGTVRRVSLLDQSQRYGRINHIKDKLNLISCDITSFGSVFEAIQKVMPDEVYHLAAQSDVGLSSEDKFQTLHTNIDGTYNILESIKILNPKIKFYFAATSELFGKVRETPQNELTPFHPRSPYAVSKAAGYYATQNYRESYNMFCCSGILMNHESSRRGTEFVTRKIIDGLKNIKNGKQNYIELGNLDSKRDWGYAREYIEAMFLMLQQKEPEDFVIGTGEAHSVREFVEYSTKKLGFDIKWKGKGLKEIGIDSITGKTIIKINPKFYRPAEVELLLADASKARKILKWVPKVKFKELIDLMIEGENNNEFKRIIKNKENF
jgi:GDPmannose 4,6-dehydratase